MSRKPIKALILIFCAILSTKAKRPRAKKPLHKPNRGVQLAGRLPNQGFHPAPLAFALGLCAIVGRHNHRLVVTHHWSAS
jgi:hypothetical protein